MTVPVNVTTTAKAPKHVVWEVLADFPNIQEYTDQVKVSVGTSENETGVGATRHCDLAPFGTTEEKILEFEPEDRIVILLHDITGIPVKTSHTTFTLRSIDENTTELTFDARVEPKGGFLKGVIGKRLEGRLPKGAQGLVDDLAASAEKKVATTNAD